MLDWLESIPNLGVRSVPGVPPQKTVILDGKPRVSARVLGVPAEHLSNIKKSQKSQAEHTQHLEHGISEQVAEVLLDDWHKRLTLLDVYEIPQRIERNRWGQLVLDCWWLYETHASRLVHEGWSLSDLWGLFVNLPGGGGLADRLQSARNVLLDGDQAMWSRSGIKHLAHRGACDGHERNGMRLVWELNG